MTYHEYLWWPLANPARCRTFISMALLSISRHPRGGAALASPNALGWLMAYPFRPRQTGCGLLGIVSFGIMEDGSIFLCRGLGSRVFANIILTKNSLLFDKGKLEML